MTENEKKLLKELRKYNFKERAEEYEALEKVLGKKVKEIILNFRAEKMRKIWERIAREYGSNSIEALEENLWKSGKEMGFEYEYTDTKEGRGYKVYKCPFADIARETGNGKWGYICYCADDPSIVEGFNREMGFRRTKTLMQGNEFCDHFYYYKDKDNK